MPIKEFAPKGNNKNAVYEKMVEIARKSITPPFPEDYLINPIKPTFPKNSSFSYANERKYNFPSVGRIDPSTYKQLRFMHETGFFNGISSFIRINDISRDKHSAPIIIAYLGTRALAHTIKTIETLTPEELEEIEIVTTLRRKVRV